MWEGGFHVIALALVVTHRGFPHVRELWAAAVWLQLPFLGACRVCSSS